MHDQPLPELLARKTTPAYRELDLKSWLADDPQAPRRRGRQSMIEEAFARATREVADGMNFSN